MQKDRAYKASVLLKYWKATRKEPIRDLCSIIAMYAQDVESGLLYAVGYATALTKDNNGKFNNTDTLAHIILQNKDGEEALVKAVANGSWRFHAFLLENKTVRVINNNGSTFDITLESKIIKMNSGNNCKLLFIVDAKMRAYEIINGTPVRVTGLPNGIKIKDISCGAGFTVFLSECGRVFGMGSNFNGKLGLPRRIEKNETPTEIAFPNQGDSDKNRIMITMIHAGGYGWVGVDSKQRAWVAGVWLMEPVRNDYESLDSCIDIIELWHSNDIRIAQIRCGFQHIIALGAEGRVYWFGKFSLGMLFCVSLDPIPFSHQIMEIRSGSSSVACKDAINEWHVWGWNAYNHIAGVCGCKAVCKETKKNDISNPMRCKWQGLFSATRVIDLQLGYRKVHVIVDLS